MRSGQRPLMAGFDDRAAKRGGRQAWNRGGGRREGQRATVPMGTDGASPATSGRQALGRKLGEPRG